MSATLNPANYAPVWSDNFAKNGYNETLFPVIYGPTGSISLSSKGVVLNSWGPSVGFMQDASGVTAGEGYGLYAANVTLQANQPNGPAVVLWPANNVWPNSELDLMETWDPTRQSGISTVHWEWMGKDQWRLTKFFVDMTKPHTYAMDWEPGTVTFYIDGKEIYSTNQNVPKDAADGGVNMVMGAELTYAPAPVSMTVSAMSYSAPKAGTHTGGSTAPPTTTTNTSHAPITPVSLQPPAKPQFASTGNLNATTSQTLYTSPGVNILDGGKGGDVFFVDARSASGWAEVDNIHHGDLVAILGFVVGHSTLKWAEVKDPNGQTGATAQVSLAGNGKIDDQITFSGTQVASAQHWTESSFNLNGTPFLSLSP
jgi:Glycosyl hydrolases family 16